MPDLKLLPLLEATRLSNVRPRLEPFFGPDKEGATPVRLDTTRLQPPICYWVVYECGGRRVTLKCFFQEEQYDRYVAQLRELYADRLDRPDHPRGGVVLVPELNGLLWAYPFDPMMPSLYRCMDGAWVAEILSRRPKEPLLVKVVDYNPEIGAVLAYRDSKRIGGRRPIVAYGKCAPEDTSALQYVVMDRLWRSPAAQSGQLRLAKPLAFRAQAGLLLQKRVPGRPIGSDRNRRIFLELAQRAGPALAAIHGTDIPFGWERSLEHTISRLRRSQADLLLTSPPLYKTMGMVLDSLESRARRTQPGDKVPSHGDYKWDQFLHSEGRFSLIDFELFCQAERWYDVGYFCAYIMPTSPEDWRDTAAAEMLRTAFMNGYAEAAGLELDLARISLHEAATLAIRADAMVRGQHPDWALRAGGLLELALDRLVSPEPKAVAAGA